MSTNFYWISAKTTVYDWDKTTYRYTPASSYEDFGRAAKSSGRRPYRCLNGDNRVGSKAPQCM